jgi:hypothetical protein
LGGPFHTKTEARGLVRGEKMLYHSFEMACRKLGAELASRPGGVAAWSPRAVQAAWAASCRSAGISEHLAAIWLHRVDAPAIPAEAQLWLRACVTDYAEIIRLVGDA